MNELREGYDQFHQGIMNRSLRYLSIGYPIHFTGPSGVGKTTLAIHIAKQLDRPIMFISGNKEMSNEDLIGAFNGYTRQKTKDNFVRSVYKEEENLSESWNEGRLYEAVKNGYTLVYDEFTRSQPETNNLFLSILEENILPLYGTKRTESYINVHPEFSIIFTSNPSEYAGVFRSQDALLDRMVTIPIENLDQQTEVATVQRKTQISKAEAKAIVSFVNSVRSLCPIKEQVSGLSLRASLKIAEISKRYEIPIQGDHKEFLMLCFDITWFPLQSCVKKSYQEKMKSKLITEIKKVRTE
ncbi:gas vesicle protein GvpN [Pontibacillus sp. HMF3514]|uniref:gas vesicle protein GvpN n=1 Tax=Pontibacillus sp. HMF3514 TaxID=2692425 RepID=UPI00131FD304|nr:gas vesicle protein GvpN [Pontibacillus sp. HMF3514]QHE50942.1 gas vesicle protein GvpN [Pontibacillus sp. HMF3514]